MKNINIVGSIIVSCFVVIGCLVSVYFAYESKDIDSEKLWHQTFQNALILVLGFWIGSAASGRLKDEIISNKIAPPAVNPATPNSPKTPS